MSKYAVIENGSVVRVVDAGTPYEVTNATLAFGPIDADGTYSNAVFTTIPFTLPNTALMQSASDVQMLDKMRTKAFNESLSKALNL